MKILFLDGTKAFSPHRLTSLPSGGIVTSLTIIPRILAQYGHEITVCSVHPKDELVEGVRYLPIEGAFSVVKPDFDVVVFNRNCVNRAVVDFVGKAKKVLWLHDIVDPRYFEDDGFMLMDKYVALSQYCKDSYADFYGIPKEKISIITNGVDRDVFHVEPNTERNPNLYICGSAPIKGLQPVEYIYRNMKRHNPDFELRLYCSQSLHDLDNDPAQARQLDKLQALGVKVEAPVSQQELAGVIRKAWCMLMPNHYPEICSNLLIQAQACGLPICAGNVGSASEYIINGITGMITTANPSDIFLWWKQLAENAAKLYMDKELHDRISRNCSIAPSAWETIATRWDMMLQDVTSCNMDFISTTNDNYKPILVEG